jgi:poly(A) polymerase
LPVTPSFLLAVMLWEPLQETMARQLVQGVSEHQAFIDAQETVLRSQADLLAVPKRFTLPAAEIWALQARLQRRRQPGRVLGHPRFRAAFDFLALRAQYDPDLQPTVDFWGARQEGVAVPETTGDDGRGGDDAAPRRRRRRRGGRRRRGQGEAAASAPATP